MLTYPLNQQEAIVVEKLYCENKKVSQVADEMLITKSRVYQIKLRALAKIKRGNKPFKATPDSRAKLERLMKRYER